MNKSLVDYEADDILDTTFDGSQIFTDTEIAAHKNDSFKTPLKQSIHTHLPSPPFKQPIQTHFTASPYKITDGKKLELEDVDFHHGCNSSLTTTHFHSPPLIATQNLDVPPTPPLVNTIETSVSYNEYFNRAKKMFTSEKSIEFFNEFCTCVSCHGISVDPVFLHNHDRSCASHVICAECFNKYAAASYATHRKEIEETNSYTMDCFVCKNRPLEIIM